jgi:TolA-binding protein
VRRVGGLAIGGVVLALGGCAQRAEVIDSERRIAQQQGEQRKQIQALQREVESLRGDVEGAPRRSGEGMTLEQRVQALDERVARLEGKRPLESDSTATEPPPVGEPPPAPIARETPPPPPVQTEDTWTRDVMRDQQAIAAGNAPERSEIAPIMDSVAKKDCGRAVSQLNSFAAQKKDSPLASHALYWAARCYALKGDRNQAISKFYDTVTKYPKGNKAAAALWEQGNLFIDMGDTPDARLALGKLIKDYPNSEEAGRARRRLTELDR